MRRAARAPSRIPLGVDFVTGSDLDDSSGSDSSNESKLLQLFVASDYDYNDSIREESDEADHQDSGEEPVHKRSKTNKIQRQKKKRASKSNRRSNLPPWKGKAIPTRSDFVKASPCPSRKARKLGKSSQWNIASSWYSLFLPPSFWSIVTRETNNYRLQNGWENSIAESM